MRCLAAAVVALAATVPVPSAGAAWTEMAPVGAPLYLLPAGIAPSPRAEALFGGGGEVWAWSPARGIWRFADEIAVPAAGVLDRAPDGRLLVAPATHQGGFERVFVCAPPGHPCHERIAEGVELPGRPGVTLEEVGETALLPDGRIGFVGILAAAQETWRAVLLAGEDGLEVLVESGDAVLWGAPRARDGGSFQALAGARESLLFLATQAIPNPPLRMPTCEVVLVRWTQEGGVEVPSRAVAPPARHHCLLGTAPGHALAWSSDADGDVAFATGSHAAPDGRVLWVCERAGSCTARARTGDAAPGAPEGALFDTFLDTELADSGALAFWATFFFAAGGGGAGVFAPAGAGPPALRMELLQPAPGLRDSILHSARILEFSAEGGVLVEARLRDPAIDSCLACETGFYRLAPNAPPLLVALSGEGHDAVAEQPRAFRFLEFVGVDANVRHLVVEAETEAGAAAYYHVAVPEPGSGLPAACAIAALVLLRGFRSRARARPRD